MNIDFSVHWPGMMDGHLVTRDCHPSFTGQIV